MIPSVLTGPLGGRLLYGQENGVALSTERVAID